MTTKSDNKLDSNSDQNSSSASEKVRPRKVNNDSEDKQKNIQKLKPEKKLTDEERIIKKVKLKLASEKESSQDKVEERLQRKLIAEQAKENLRRQIALGSLPVNFPPADFWRQAFTYLKESQLIKTRGICKYFLYFYPKEIWLNVFIKYLEKQGFTPEPVLKLVNARYLLSTKRSVIRMTEMAQMEKEIGKCRNPNLIRVIINLKVKRKNFDFNHYIPLFYDRNEDDHKYRELIVDFHIYHILPGGVLMPRNLCIGLPMLYD